MYKEHNTLVGSLADQVLTSGGWADDAAGQSVCGPDQKSRKAAPDKVAMASLPSGTSGSDTPTLQHSTHASSLVV